LAKSGLDSIRLVSDVIQIIPHPDDFPFSVCSSFERPLASPTGFGAADSMLGTALKTPKFLR
jgi:hypothetical protein